MSTATPILFEFRCTSCYQSLLAETEASGSNLECRWCGHSLRVPEPSADAIERGRAYTEGDQALQGLELVASEPAQTPEARMRLAKQLAAEQAKTRRVTCKDPSKRCASRISRLVAHLVDCFAIALACSLALVGALAAYGLGLREMVLRGSSLPAGFWLIATGLPTVFNLGHCITISLYGKTIGKYLMKTRIVDASGNAPGFMRGVAIRHSIWVITTIIPCAPILHYAGLWPDELAFTSRTSFELARIGCLALSLANIFAICLEPPRCVHDRLAGTYVIDD